MVLIGRLIKDAVVAQLKDERKVVNFTIAMNDYYKPKGSETGISVASYINCAYWIYPGIAERLTKGSLVEISGRLSVNAYMSMQGEAKASLHCHVNAIKVHQRMKTEATVSNPQKQPQDELPF